VALLKTHDKAPDFNLINQAGDIVKLSTFRGHTLLLYFYPRAGTPGCTRQAAFVRDARDELKALGITVVGVSPDKTEALQRFAEKNRLEFSLLSDPDRSAAKAYGAWGKKTMYGKSVEGIIRSAFFIDKTGFVQNAWYKIKPEDMVPFAMNVLKK
jgi:thioredoxin-dependent peroxiredoxin